MNLFWSGLNPFTFFLMENLQDYDQVPLKTQVPLRTKQIQFYLLLHVPCFPCLSLFAGAAGGFLASHFLCSSMPASGACIASESDVDAALMRVCVISSAPCEPDSLSSLCTQFLQLPVHVCLWGIEAS